MLTVAETPEFTKQAEKLFTEEQVEALKMFLSVNPLAGDVIKGSGGVRKLRWQSKQRGKRGGARVIYFYYDERLPLTLITAYGKNEKDDLSAGDLRAAAMLAEAIKGSLEHGKKYH
jgi:mRNA-degrading endonuclease RelE of RelBE toxin-antitoxin system